MGKRILIADDEIDYFSFIQDALEEYGYSVIAVDNAESAIKLAAKSFFDLILLDINMPAIDGLEAFKEIKKISPLSFVVMMTAGAPQDMIKKALQEGSYAVVYKPFKLDKLVEIIDSALNQTTILVVDDLFADRELLKDLLEAKGYKSTSVEDGFNAVELLKNNKPDIIFVDIRMPGMDGFELLKKVRQMHPQAGVIMMSAYFKEEYLEKSLSMGAFTCLEKPLKIDPIIGLIDKIRHQKDVLDDKHKILLVEDDPDLRETLTDVFQSSGYSICAVSSGTEAINESRKVSYDAVVMDLKLPDMSGIEAIKRVKETSPDVVAIIMTAHESLQAAIDAIKENVFDFLIKPVDPQVLIKSIRKGLSNKLKK